LIPALVPAGGSPRRTSQKRADFILIFIGNYSKTAKTWPSAPESQGENDKKTACVTYWNPMGAQEPKANAVPNCLVLNREFLK